MPEEEKLAVNEELFVNKIKHLLNTHIVGVLKGFDPLLNLVLDSTTEYLRDSGEIE